MKIKRENKLILVLTLLFVSVSAVFGLYLINNGAVAEEVTPAYYIEGGDESTVQFGKWKSLGNREGLVASLASSDTLVMRQVIDLNETGMNKPIISLRSAPENVGAADYGCLKILFVDVYDETNYVIIRIRYNPDGINASPCGYVRAGASNGQELKAFNASTTEGWTSYLYGTGAKFPFYDGNMSNVSLYLDPATNCVYVASEYKIWGNSLDGELNYIVDLDDSDIYGTLAWKGFTTGEIYCKIFCEEYIGSTASFMIDAYGDYNLRNAELSDTEGPVINIDYDGYSESSVPNGITGANYPLFKATAFDLYSGKSDVTVKVFENYYSTEKKEFTVKDGLTFTPTYGGDYYAVYTSVDKFNNNSEKILHIPVLDKKGITPLGFTLGEYESTVKLADAFTLPTVSVTNNVGRFSVEIEAELNGESIPVEDGEFVRPYKTGELKIKITANDYVGQIYSETVTVNVVATDIPTFIELPVLPKYLIEGNKYLLPEIKAYNYVDGSGNVLPVTVKAQNKNGELVAVNGIYTPEVLNSGDTVDVVYESSLNGKTNSLINKIPVYKVKKDGNLDMSEYFVISGDASAEVTRDSVSFTVNGDSTVSFINGIYNTSVSAEILGTESSDNIGNFKVVLTDYYDQDKKIVLNYERENGSWWFYLNGDKTNKLSVANGLSSGNRFKFEYDNVKREISFDGGKKDTVKAEYDVSGKKFTGFLSNEFYLSFEFSDLRNSAKVNLYKINNSYFSNEKRDYVKPDISFLGDYGGDRRLNEIYVLPKALIADLFDGKQVEPLLTVEDPNGNIVTSVEGKLLEDYSYDVNEEITLKLDTYGTYYVSYFAHDGYNNRLNFTYALRVADMEKPKLTLTSDFPDSVKVSDRVYIPTAEISDNKDSTEDLSLEIYIVLPSGMQVKFDGTTVKGFVASEAGTYKIIYSLRDTEGNILTSVYTVKALGE